MSKRNLNQNIPSLTAFAAIRSMENPHAHVAASVGDAETLQRLAADSRNLEQLDALGRTPLRVAAEGRWKRYLIPARTPICRTEAATVRAMSGRRSNGRDLSGGVV